MLAKSIMQIERYNHLDERETKHKGDPIHLYYIDVMETALTFEAWLSKENYGVSMLMFGVPKHQAAGDTNKEQFIEMVERSVNDYIDFYKEEYETYNEGYEE